MFNFGEIENKLVRIARCDEAWNWEMRSHTWSKDPVLPIRGDRWGGPSFFAGPCAARQAAVRAGSGLVLVGY